MKIELVRPPSPASSSNQPPAPFLLATATAADRETIYRARHEVYARELGQHAPNHSARLRDPLDDSNVYLLAKVAGDIAAFISLTPPGGPAYSIDKHLDHLERSHSVINADVLDAWFPPAPGVLAALREHLPWLLRTSPPTGHALQG